MKQVMDQIIEDWDVLIGIDENLIIEIIPVYAGSATLARQIEHGAQADIFISANVTWMQYLVQKNIIKKEDIRLLTRNRLMLATHEQGYGAHFLDSLRNAKHNNIINVRFT